MGENMSRNAEPVAKSAASNKSEWDTTLSWEQAAVKAAIETYARTPGTDERVAMMRACRVYAAKMGERLGWMG